MGDVKSKLKNSFVLTGIKFYPLYKNWNAKELELLFKNYAEKGTKIAFLRETRSPNQIRQAASDLGIKFTNFTSRGEWTLDEIEILKTYYPLIGVKTSGLLNKSDLKVGHKATQLKIRYKAPNITQLLANVTVLRRYNLSSWLLLFYYLLAKKNKRATWSADEIKILVKKYKKIGMRVKTLLKDKTETQITSKAYLLGLIYTQRGWTAEEDKLVLELYPKIGAKLLDKLPGKNIKSLSWRASKLGCNKHKKK